VHFQHFGLVAASLRIDRRAKACDSAANDDDFPAILLHAGSLLLHVPRAKRLPAGPGARATLRQNTWEEVF
jgi:hypothetical protein